jgi:probable F420-dependent oxidoreductase
MVYTPDSADPATVAGKAEEVGFESIWLGEHPIIPVNYSTQYPLTADGKLPGYYHQICDPFIILAAAAAATKKIRLATGICLLAERNPLLLAKEVGTLDHISGGRVILGVGAGFFREEAEIMGADFSRRYLRLRESIQAMREIWTKDEAEFHGKVIDFPPIRCEPKPVQKPHPPVHLGGAGERVLKRVAKWADGWCPVAFVPPEQAGQDLKRLGTLAEEAGRDPSKIETSIFVGVTETSPVADIIKQWEDVGAHRVVLALGAVEGPLVYVNYSFDKFTPSQVEATLERLAEKAFARLS